MLFKLQKILDKNNLTKYKSIKDLSLFCNSEFKVIDFDHLKETFSKIIKLKDSPKSADCLYIDVAKNMLTFIEIKDLEKVIEFQNADFNRFFKKANLKYKVFDSFSLILAILDYYNVNTSDTSFYPENIHNSNKKTIKIQFIILANISSRDYIRYRISHLANIKDYEYGFINSVNIIQSKTFKNLMNTEKLDDTARLL